MSGVQPLWLIMFAAVTSLGFLTYALSTNARDARAQHQATQSLYSHTLDVLLVAERIDTGLNKALRGERGYLLSSDRRSLKTFEQGRSETISYTLKLAKLTRDNPSQQVRVARLRAVSGKYLNWLENVVDLTRNRQIERALAYETSGESRERIEAVRVLLSEIRDEERRLLVKRQAAASLAWARNDRLGRILGFLNWLLLIAVGSIAFATVQARAAAVRTANALRISEAALLKARDAAEAAAEAKSRFIANMSHEIRTPLQGMIGFADLLATSNLPSEQQRQAHIVADSARALNKIVSDILDLSKADAGGVELEQVPFHLPKLLEDCCRLMAPAAATKGLSISAHCDPKLPVWLLGDPHRVRQILVNLLSNAVKFTEIGSITLSATPNADDADSFVMLDVIDTGIGIADERQEVVFEPFVQADDSTSRRFGGTGLGLTISRELARVMGGAVTLKSAEGIGTRVTVRLPLVVTDPPSEKDKDPVAEATVPSGFHVLLAEDNEVNQELLATILRKAGHRVDTVGNGRDAIEAVRRRLPNQAYDLIFMDVQMPIVDGLLATRAIRSLPGQLQLPIVALTASSDPAAVARCREAGMTGHLTKPVTAEDLLDLMGSWLQTTRDVSTPSDVSEIEIMRPSFEAMKDSIAARLSQIEQLLEKGADQHALLTEVAEIAHKLSGSAGIFGDTKLGEIARATEQKLKATEHYGVADAEFASDIFWLKSALLDAPLETRSTDGGIRQTGS